MDSIIDFLANILGVGISESLKKILGKYWLIILLIVIVCIGIISTLLLTR